MKPVRPHHSEWVGPVVRTCRDVPTDCRSRDPFIVPEVVQLRQSDAHRVCRQTRVPRNDPGGHYNSPYNDMLQTWFALSAMWYNISMTPF
jgi:hypothetical protein